MQEFEVNDLPQDGISRVQFCHNGIDNDHMLLVSSWDKVNINECNVIVAYSLV